MRKANLKNGFNTLKNPYNDGLESMLSDICSKKAENQARPVKIAKNSEKCAYLV